jgi:TonB family protein
MVLFSVGLFGQDTVPSQKGAPPIKGGKGTASENAAYPFYVFKPEETVYWLNDTIIRPKATHTPDPEYSDLGRMMKLNTVSVLRCVIRPDGRAYVIEVKRPAGAGLDELAIEAIEKWRFKPATKQGVAVAVETPVEITFHMDLQGDFDSVTNRLNRIARKSKVTDLQKLAENGDRQAQLLLGYLYWTGREPGRYEDADPLASIAWLKRAADQGSGTAAYLLGFVDQDRQPRQFDYARCYKWWAIAWVAKMPIDKEIVGNVAQKIKPKDLLAVQQQTRQWLAAHKVVNDLPK